MDTEETWLDRLGERIWWWKPMNKGYKRQQRWRTFVTVLFFPINAYDAIKFMPKMIKESFGCTKGLFHDFQWNIGNVGWWMYCTKCEKPVWRDNE